jgi:choline dehydrogenase
MRRTQRLWSSTLLTKNRYDYIVVGGGSSGCVLADTLSENGKNSVLLLEAGKSSDYYPWFHIPVGYLFTIDNPRSDWCFKTSPEKYLNNRRLLYPRGYGLGGSSLINGMIYMRGQQADYDHWADVLQDKSWNWESILPIFLKHENYHGEGGRFHGKSGKWRVEKVRTNWEILDAFIDASEKYGIPRTKDFNTGDNTGVGYFDVNQRDGWRLNAFQAFLSSPKENLTICSSSHVDKLLFSTTNNSLVNEPQCVGVSVRVGNEFQSVYAEKEVILTAGAIGSVQLLERSGVGQHKHLESLGIDVVHQLAGVGENLQDHLQLRLVFEVENTPTLNLRANSLLGKIGIAWEYLTSRTGPMASAPSQLGAFCKSSSKHETANIQYHIQPLSLPAFGQPLDSFNAFTASVCDLRPTSVGSVHIQSPGFSFLPPSPQDLVCHRDQLASSD